MKTKLFQIWFDGDEIGRGSGNPFHILRLDAAEFPDVQSVMDAIRADEWIEGTHLDSRWGQERGVRLVTAEKPMAFRGAAVARITEPSWRFDYPAELQRA